MGTPTPARAPAPLDPPSSPSLSTMPLSYVAMNDAPRFFRPGRPRIDRSSGAGCGGPGGARADAPRYASDRVHCGELFNERLGSQTAGLYSRGVFHCAACVWLMREAPAVCADRAD